MPDRADEELGHMITAETNSGNPSQQLCSTVNPRRTPVAHSDWSAKERAEPSKKQIDTYTISLTSTHSWSATADDSLKDVS